MKDGDKYNKNAQKRVTFQVVRAGQVRPYGPSVTEATVIFEKNPTFAPVEQHGTFVPWDNAIEGVVKRVIKLLIADFYEKDDEGAGWASPMLKSLVQFEPGKWRVIIESAYTD